MTAADQLKAEITIQITKLDMAILLLRQVDKRLDEVNGSVLAMEFSSPHPSTSGTVHIGQQAKDSLELTIRQVTDIAQRLVLRRNSL